MTDLRKYLNDLSFNRTGNTTLNNDGSADVNDTNGNGDSNETNPLDLLDTIGSDNPSDSPSDGVLYDDDGNEVRLNLDDDKSKNK